MERMVWTDERLDDAFARIEKNFDHVWEEFREMKSEMREGFRELRSNTSALQRQLTTIGWAIVSVLIAQLVAAIVVLG